MCKFVWFLGLIVDGFRTLHYTLSNAMFFVSNCLVTDLMTWQPKMVTSVALRGFWTPLLLWWFARWTHQRPNVQLRSTPTSRKTGAEGYVSWPNPLAGKLYFWLLFKGSFYNERVTSSDGKGSSEPGTMVCGWIWMKFGVNGDHSGNAELLSLN